MVALISLGLMMLAAIAALTALVCGEIAATFGDAEQRAFDRRFDEIVRGLED